MARLSVVASSKPLVGVDIGSSSIKLCEIEEGRDGRRRLVRCAVHPLPPQTVVDGHIINTGAVVQGLEQLFLKAKRRDVAMRMGGHSVIVKKLSLPLMTNAELSQQMQWEAQQHIPFNISEVHLDYQVLRRREQHGQMDVLLVAAKREEVGDLVQLAQEARLRPKVVDLDAFAMQNLYEVCYGAPGSGDTVVLLCVGAAMTTLNVLRDGNTAFTRDLVAGGEAITARIHRHFGVPYEEAERFKRGPAGAADVPAELAPVIETAADELAAEVQRLLDFYLATSGENALRAVYVCGGMASCEPFLRLLKNRIGADVRVLDSAAYSDVDSSAVDVTMLGVNRPQLAIAMGLGLRREREMDP